MQRQCKVSATARRENFVLPDLILPNRSLLYAKIIKDVCNVNTITLFFSNQEYIKKHKITVLNVKLSLLQTENYAVEIRKTESESKNGSIRHIAQHPVTQRIIQNNLPTTLFLFTTKVFPQSQRGSSVMQERLSDTPKRTFLPPQKARLTGTRHAEHYLTEQNTHFKPPKTRRR